MKSGESAIGVAVADTPVGPFRAQPQPLVTMEQTKRIGIAMGQTIDPSVFLEDDGTPYLLFGNVHPAIVRLGEDMTSVIEDTMKNLVGLYDFREAVTVLKRDGQYHFTWSCDDTGSEDYHVNYGTAEQLYGPVTYRYPVLVKNKEKGMLGTGHHSILREPGTDK